MNLLRKYFKDIYEGLNSSVEGLGLTLLHLFQARKRTNSVSIASKDYFKQETGIVTLEYPFQSFPVPDNGRYRLHNEIDDCIVCDKCAKICPVDCIDITSIRSVEEIGLTSDGSSKRLYAATFDIDMAKCCFCGLCTTVCPTECLTMTPTYDFSEFDVTNMVYHFTDLTPEEAKEKQRIFEVKQAEKAAVAAAKLQVQPETTSTSVNTEIAGLPKPLFKPKFPTSKASEASEGEIKDVENPIGSKPVFKPKMPGVKSPEMISPPSDKTDPSENVVGELKSTAPKPVYKPKMPGIKAPEAATSSPEVPLKTEEAIENIEDIEKSISSKLVFIPKIPGLKAPEPVTPSLEIPIDSLKSATISDEPEKPVTLKPVFKPKMKPIIPPKKEDDPNNL